MQPSARFTGRLSSEVETDPSFQRAQLHRQAADALPFADEGENEEQGECVRFISLHFITRRPRFSLSIPRRSPFHQPPASIYPLRRERVGVHALAHTPWLAFLLLWQPRGTLTAINQGTTEYIINTHA